MSSRLSKLAMGKFILFTSGKGGVGKSTLVYHVGKRFARLGKKTLLLDADVGLKNLDLIARVSNVANYDLFDVYSGHASLEDAYTKIMPDLNLLTLYGATTLGYLTDDVLLNVMKKLQNTFDYILIDSPAGIEKGFELTRKVADMFVMVLNPTLTSFHDANKVISILKRSHQTEISLVLNRFHHRDLEFFKSRGGSLKFYETLGIVNELKDSFLSKKIFEKNIEGIAKRIISVNEIDRSIISN